MKQSWVAFKTLSEKECSRVLRVWIQTILPPVVTITLYFVIFGRVVGRFIGDLHGFSYMEFITPGLVMMAAINNTYANVSSSLFADKLLRPLEMLLVSPVSHTTLLWGYLSGGIFRGTLVAVVVMIAALFFEPLHFSHIFILLSSFFLTLILLALFGFINALFARTFDDVSLVPTFVLTPLTYLGGVFYSIHTMSPVWKTISLFNPIVYIINLFRYGMLGYSDIPVASALWILFAFNVVTYSVVFWMLKKGVGIRS